LGRARERIALAVRGKPPSGVKWQKKGREERVGGGERSGG
jgi:hypothetical protein